MPKPLIRYEIRQGDLENSPCHNWYLWDRHDRKVVFRSDSQSAVVQKAQERSNFRPEDGNPDTYARQVLAKISLAGDGIFLARRSNTP